MFLVKYSRNVLIKCYDIGLFWGACIGRHRYRTSFAPYIRCKVKDTLWEKFDPKLMQNVFITPKTPQINCTQETPDNGLNLNAIRH